MLRVSNAKSAVGTAREVRNCSWGRNPEGSLAQSIQNPRGGSSLGSLHIQIDVLQLPLVPQSRQDPHETPYHFCTGVPSSFSPLLADAIEGRAPTTDKSEPGPPSPAVTLDLEVNLLRQSRRGKKKATTAKLPPPLKATCSGKPGSGASSKS